jgi:hypothetical protein
MPLVVYGSLVNNGIGEGIKTGVVSKTRDILRKRYHLHTSTTSVLDDCC